jgi:predicted DNA binding protein
MRILRLKISAEMVKNMKFGLFEKLEYLEILNTWQYSQKNFFSVQKMVFKPEFQSILDDIDTLKKEVNATYIQILRKKENEILCILQQHLASGFWPMLKESKPWALIPPITVDKEYILLTIVAPKEYVQNLFQMVNIFTNDYTVLAVERMDNVDRIEEMLGITNLPYPTFTDRQREIATFAVRNGFYQSPKNISAQAIADEKGISVSAVNEHLRKVERVAMDFFFGEKNTKTNLKKRGFLQRINPFRRR